MEVRIRLQKAGKAAHRSANYRIVAIGRSLTRDGKRLDILGYYDPTKKPAVVSINKEKLNGWLQKGAQMTDTVKSLVKKA